MKFSDQFLDQIRARIPISDVVGRTVIWDRKKSMPNRGDHWACCPFHSEKTPSFHADDRRQRYHCFGCKASGDIFRFLMDKHGLTFFEAVEQLAGEAGLELPKPDPQFKEREQQKADLYQVMELACTFFESQLETRNGASARGYLNDRGLALSTQKQFRLGYAPSGKSGLKEHLQLNKISVKQMIDAGLLVHGDDIEIPFDRFRDRIMFPIEDVRGRIVAFGGRAMSPDARAKYLNSPETEIFSKGQILYNFRNCQQIARDRSTVIAVEGYMDVIALSQAGLPNCIAPLGTALTSQQIELLWRMNSEPTLLFDGDEAGLKAAYRAADLVLSQIRPGKSLRFGMIPGNQDPDDLVKSEGREAVEDLIKKAIPLVELLWMRESKETTLDTPERRAAFEHRLKAIGNSIGHEDVRRHYQDSFRQRIQELWQASRRKHFADTGYKRSNNFQQRGKSKQSGFQGRKSIGTQAGLSLRNSAVAKPRNGALVTREIAIVLPLFNHPELVVEECETISQISFGNKQLEDLVSLALDVLAQDEKVDRDTLTLKVHDAGYSPLLDEMRQRAKASYIGWLAPDEPFDTVFSNWQQALILHNRMMILHKELQDIEKVLASDGDLESYERLVEIKKRIANEEGLASQEDDANALTQMSAIMND